MKQLTINIPDNYIPDFIEYFSHIPDASILYESEFIITPEMVSILDKSHSIDNTKYLTIEESNRLLKLKHGL
jgi:hypothetical protein